jgi:hypothetical protein
MLTGSCLCRAIRYEVTTPITELRACHCKDCQKASGRGRILHRFFCGDCGSPLYSRRELDDAPPMKITANIWTNSARPWAYIGPETKRYPGQPDPASTRA